MKYLLVSILYITNIYSCECSLETIKLDKKVKLLAKLSKCKLKVSSGYRTKSKNAKVGGVYNSLHLRNLARDLVIVNNCSYSYMKLGEMARHIFPGVIVYPTHLHVDMRKKRFFGIKTRSGIKNILTTK